MASPTRRGRAVCLTLDHEAVEILRTLSESARSHGKLVSVLLRQEEQRRLDARARRQGMALSEGELVHE